MDINIVQGQLDPSSLYRQVHISSLK